VLTSFSYSPSGALVSSRKVDAALQIDSDVALWFGMRTDHCRQ
jgi:hypothetical protein